MPPARVVAAASLASVLLAAVAAPPAKARPPRPSAPLSLSAAQLFARGKFTEARAAYAAEAASCPERPAASIGQIRTLLRLDRWDEAAATGEKAAKRFPNSGDVRGIFALALLRAGRPDEALAEAEAALRQEPGSYWALVAAGRLADVWRYDEKRSLLLLRRAVALRPREPEGLLYLSSATTYRSDAECKAAMRRLFALRPSGAPFDRLLPMARAFLANLPRHRKIFPQGTFNLRSRGDSFEVPVDWTNDDVTLTAQIDGLPFRLLLDTGGNENVTIAPERLKGMKLQKVGQQVIIGVHGAGTAGAYRAETLKMGGLEMAPVDVSAGASQSAKLLRDGEIGGFVFQEFALTFRKGVNTMTIARSKKAAGGDAAPLPLPRYETAGDAGGAAKVEIPFRLLQDKIVLPIRLEGRRFWAVLDTGASFTTILSERVAAPLRAKAPANQVQRQTVSERIGYGDERKSISFTRFPFKTKIYFDHGEAGKGPDINFQFEGFTSSSTLDDVVNPGSGFEFGAVIGQEFLNNFAAVTIDYPKRLLTLELKSPPKATPQPEKPLAATDSSDAQLDPTRNAPFAVKPGNQAVYYSFTWVEWPDQPIPGLIRPAAPPSFTLAPGYVALRFADKNRKEHPDPEARERIRRQGGEWVLVPETAGFDASGVLRFLSPECLPLGAAPEACRWAWLVDRWLTLPAGSDVDGVSEQGPASGKPAPPAGYRVLYRRAGGAVRVDATRLPPATSLRLNLGGLDKAEGWVVVPDSSVLDPAAGRLTVR